MKRNSFKAVLTTSLLLMFTSLNVVASDTTAVPADGQSIKGYYEYINKELVKPFSNKISGIYLVLPSFKPEYVMLLDEENGKAILRHRKFKENLWYALKNSKKPGIVTSQVELSTKSQKIIREFFANSYTYLMSNKKSPGLDGTTYYFMIPDSSNTTMLRAEVWSPEKDSEEYRIVEKAEKLLKALLKQKYGEENLQEILKD